MSRDEKLRAAVRESGQALVNLILETCQAIEKVTILPRGTTASAVVTTSTIEEHSLTGSIILARISALLGGRAAEEIILGSRGVSNVAIQQQKQATTLAYYYVKAGVFSAQTGISNYHGIRKHGTDVQDRIDATVARIMEEQYHRAFKVIQ